MKLNFRQALLKFVAPELRTYGYEYDDTLRDRNLMYGFRKDLGNGVGAIIEFQRHAHEERPVGYGFTVNLIRRSMTNVREWPASRYVGPLWERLGAVLWFVYKLRIYPMDDHWWSPKKPEQYAEQFADVVDKLVRYGIPWLEDPQSRDVMVEYAPPKDDIREMMQKIVAPALASSGFETKEHEVGTPYCVKHLEWGLYAIVLFIFSPILDSVPQRYMFHVQLMRKDTANPFDHLLAVDGKNLYEMLGPVLWYVYDLRIYPSEEKRWEYGSREELDQQLEDAVDKIKQYAIPWLENPASRNPWSDRTNS